MDFFHTPTKHPDQNIKQRFPGAIARIRMKICRKLPSGYNALTPKKS